MGHLQLVRIQKMSQSKSITTSKPPVCRLPRTDQYPILVVAPVVMQSSDNHGIAELQRSFTDFLEKGEYTDKLRACINDRK